MNIHIYTITSNHQQHRYRFLQPTATSVILIVGLLQSSHHPAQHLYSRYRLTNAFRTTTNIIVHKYNYKSTKNIQNQIHRQQHLHQNLLLNKMLSSSTTPTPPSTEQVSSQQQQRWMISPMERNGKRLPKASIQAVLITTACIPVWAVTVLPLSIIYQIGSMFVRQLKKITVSNPSHPPQPSLQISDTTTAVLDSGYVVEPSSIIPHSERTYDIVILGVTGFTGYLAARHLIKTYGIGGSTSSVKWAIAGRSIHKLNDVKERLSHEFDPPMDVSQLEMIVVDTSIPSTLPKLVAQTRVVATTAGPYTLYGNHVVEFCTKFGTHYVDITGEVDWIKTMIYTWQSTAQQTGAKIIPFCGHDSIPWDISAMVLQQKLYEEQGDYVSSMAFYDEMVGGAPGGTFATIMTNIEGKAIKAPRVAFDPFLRLPDGTKSDRVCNADLTMLPQKRSPPQWDEFPTDTKSSSSPKKWTTPFVMALVNSQVVRWSYALQSTMSHANTFTYSESVVHTNFSTAYVNYVGMILFGSMLFNPITAYLMKHYLLPKPGDGPSMQNMENKRKFASFYYHICYTNPLFMRLCAHLALYLLSLRLFMHTW